MSPRKYLYILDHVSEDNVRYYLCESAPRCPGAGKMRADLRGLGFVVTHGHIHAGHDIISYPTSNSRNHIEVFINGSLVSTNLHENETVFHECVDDDSSCSVVQPYVELYDPDLVYNPGRPERVLQAYYVPSYGEDNGDNNQENIRLHWPFPLTVTYTKLRSVERKGIFRSGYVLVVNIGVTSRRLQRGVQSPVSGDDDGDGDGDGAPADRPEESGAVTPPQAHHCQGFCMVCLSSDATVKHVIIPCGHSWMCRPCVEQGLESCPVCRVAIHDFLRVLETSI